MELPGTQHPSTIVPETIICAVITGHPFTSDQYGGDSGRWTIQARETGRGRTELACEREQGTEVSTKSWEVHVDPEETMTCGCFGAGNYPEFCTRGANARA